MLKGQRKNLCAGRGDKFTIASRYLGSVWPMDWRNGQSTSFRSGFPFALSASAEGISFTYSSATSQNTLIAPFGLVSFANSSP